jgi:catechol 2,3-dioxygenase-like lactoylglutathione lyase family enzyme
VTEELDHIGLKVHDFARSRAFYKAVLEAVGMKLLTEFEHDGHHHAGFGRERPVFWIGDSRETAGKAHVAFAARSRSEVEAFHAIAVSAGGKDNGAPGLRPVYHPDYFGAFVLDPDGNNVEAVFHG